MPEIISANTGAAIAQWTPDSPARIGAVLDRLPLALAALAPPDARVAVLTALIAALDHNKDRLAEVIVAEVGKTPGEAVDEVAYARGFVEHALTQVPGPAPQTGDRRLRVVPAGPVLAITPYNDPLAGILRKVAPAIAAGCPVVVKPSALSHLTAQIYFDALGEGGLAGAVTMLNHTDRDVLGRLVADPVFRVLSFTGSTETGLDPCSEGRAQAAGAGTGREQPLSRARRG
jgi:succinate-semialdehyde dehydrogenase / glutarate-semialdehyde dehydrogenase